MQAPPETVRGSAGRSRRRAGRDSLEGRRGEATASQALRGTGANQPPRLCSAELRKEPTMQRDLSKQNATSQDIERDLRETIVSMVLRCVELPMAVHGTRV